MNPTVTLRLTADNSKLVPVVRTSKDEVEALGKAATGTGQQAQRGGQGVASFGASADQATRKVTAMNAAVNAAKTAMAGYIGLQGGRALVALSDEYANISGRLKLATNGQQAFAAAQAEVFNISQRTSTALESTATLYARLAQSTAEYGVSQQRQLALTETINRTFAISGASAVAAANTITQFTQALAGGVLRAEEFNSVIENSPRLAKALADGLGVGMGELRKQVNDGLVSVDRLVKALESQSAVIQAEFEQMPLTVERAMVQLRNSITKFVGEGSQELGAGSALANGIALLAQNLDALDKVVGVVAVAFGSRLTASLIKGTAEKIAAAAAARALAREELQAARAAEAQAAGRVSLARAGISATGGLAAAEAALASAQLRTAAAAQAASVALTAKAAAMRALNTAMAAFGGPVGLAITALTLFVMWVSNSSRKAEELSKTVTAGFQPAIETLKSFSQATANTSFAGLASSVETLEAARNQVEALAAAAEKASQERASREARYGAALATQIDAQQRAAQAHAAAKLRLDQLSAGYEKAIDTSAKLVLQTAGITNVTEAQRQSLDELLKRQSNQGLTLEQNKPLLVEWIRKQGDVAAANRLAAATFEEVGQAASASGAAIKNASAEIAQDLDKQINQLQLKVIEQTQGKAAALRAGFVKQLANDGIDPTSQVGQRLRAQNEQVVALTEQLDRATKAQQAKTKAEQDAKQAADKLQQIHKQQEESQAKYAAQALEAAAALSGPLAAAEGAHAKRVAELDRELAKHNITQEAYNVLVNASTAELSKQAAELAKQQQAPQGLLDAMSDEIRILGAVGIARERATRLARNEHDMLEAIADANRAGAGITAEMTGKLVEQARAYADLSIAVEEHAADVQEWADVATRGVADFSDLLADGLSGSLDETKSFWDSMQDIFRRGWRDAIRTLLEQNLVRPVQNALSDLISGAFNSASSTGSSWMSSLAGLIGGGRGLTATGAIAASSNWGASIAAGAGSMMGFGNNLDSFASATGMAGSGAGAGSASILGLAGNAGMLYKAANWLSNGKLASWMAGAKGTASKLLGSTGGLWGSAALGALYGWKQGGDTLGKGLGAAAYGTAGYAAAAAGSAALAGGSALAAVPVAGWIALGAIALDKLSGGGLFGTKYKTQSTTQMIDIGQEGANVSATAYQTRKKSLFRGTARRTVNVAVSEESRQAANDVYELVRDYARGAADALGLASVEIVRGSYKAVYDKKGNLTSELSTVLGQTFSESFEDFQKRLGAENIIGQIDQLDGTATQVAQRWRSSADSLLEGAQFLLAAATDFNDGTGLLTTGGLSRMADLIELLQRSDETLTEAYKRVTGQARDYGQTAAAAYQDVATAGFSSFATSLLQIKQQEKERIETLKAQAKALGGLSAREEDLIAVRQAAQVQADTLVASLKSELVDLALNRINDQIEQLGGAAEGTSTKLADFMASLRLSDTLSTSTDAGRRTAASDLMRSAAASGNVDSFINYAQQFLEISRALNASGAGYQADYNTVMQLAAQLGADGSSSSLQQLYAQRDALQAQQAAAARLERAQRIAQGVGDLAGVSGGDPLEILRSVTGLTPEALAGDLGLSVSELSDYLAQQQTDIGDLADILYDLPDRIASAMVTVLADRNVPLGTTSGATTNNAGGTSSSNATDAILAEVNDGIQTLVRLAKNGELYAL